MSDQPKPTPETPKESTARRVSEQPRKEDNRKVSYRITDLASI